MLWIIIFSSLVFLYGDVRHETYVDQKEKRGIEDFKIQLFLLGAHGVQPKCGDQLGKC